MPLDVNTSIVGRLRINKTYLLKNVNNLNIQKKYQDYIYGTYSKSVSVEGGGTETKKYGFIYNPDKSVNKLEISEISYIDEFDSSDLAKVYGPLSSDNWTISYMDLRGNIRIPFEDQIIYGSKIYPNYVSTTDVVIGKDSNNLFSVYILGSDSSYDKKISGLFAANANGIDPILLTRKDAQSKLSFTYLELTTQVENINPATETKEINFTESDSSSIKILSDATSASPFINGLAYIENAGKVYSIDRSFKATLVENAVSSRGNVIKYDNLDGTFSLKYKHNNSLLDFEIPVQNNDINNIHPLDRNLYQYINTSGKTALFYFNPNGTASIHDIGEIKQIFPNYQNSEYYHYSKSNGSDTTSGFIKVDGTLKIENTGAGSFGYQIYEGLIKVYDESAQKSTLLKMDGTNLLDPLSGEDVYFKELQINGNLLRVRQDSGSFSSAYISSDRTTLTEYPGIDIGEIGDYKQFYRMDKKEKINGYEKEFYGLMTLDGQVIFHPDKYYTGFTVNENLGYIVPRVTTLDETGKPILRENGTTIDSEGSVYDLKGNIFSKLNGYQFNGTDTDGSILIRKKLPYKRIFFEQDKFSTDDIYVHNKYFPETDSFLFQTNDTKTPIDYQNVWLIENSSNSIYSFYKDLENNNLTASQTDGGNTYYFKASGEYKPGETTLYMFPTTAVIYTNSMVPLISFGQYDSISQFSNDALLATQNFDPSTQKFTSGLIDSNGAVKVENNYDNIWYERNLNQYILQKEYRYPNSYSQSGYDSLWTSSFYDPATDILTDRGFTNFNFNDLFENGYAVVGILPNYQSIKNSSSLESDPYQSLKWGILNRDFTYKVEPIYDNIGEINKSGYAIVEKKTGSFQENTWIDEKGNEHSETWEVRKRGLINLTAGVVLDAKYDVIDTTYSRRSNWDVPPFDKDGLIKIGIYPKDGPALFGLANEDGELFEGAAYLNAYFKDGYYYLKETDTTWRIVSSDFRQDKRIEIPVTLDTQETVESISLTGDYIIASVLRNSNQGFNSYEYYGVLNKDLSVFLPFDYSSITYDGNVWNLEIYNSTFGTYQKAVMDKDSNYILPFTNKYDALGEYVNDYAIGSSGIAEEDSVNSNVLNIPAENTYAISDEVKLSSQVKYEKTEIFSDNSNERKYQVEQFSAGTFLSSNTNSSEELVLDVIDKEGRIISDLADEYESAILLGEVNGVTKALVKKDGKYYIATLVEKQETLIPITEVRLSHTSASIYENDTFQLTSSILPENSNEPKKVLWESLNSSIAEVDQRGKVKGKSPGNTTIKFSVNDFIQTCNISVIAVPADSKDSAAEIIKQAETLLATQTTETTGEDVISDTAGNLPISFTEAVTKLVGMLRGQEDLDPENFKQAIMEISQQVPNFVTYLSEDEAQLLDAKILEIFQENLKINFSSSEIPVQITGLALNVDLVSLCKGEKITVDVMLNKQISQEDQKRLSAYASEKNIDMSLIYSFDITINQKTGENSTKLTSLYRPVKVTLQLPEQFIGIGDLEIIQIHNGEPSIHPVQLNDDLTFTFETDQFSSFTLVKASLKNNVISKVVNPKFEDPILPVTNRSINSNAWLNISLLMILLILGSAAIIVVRKKRISR